MWSCWQDRGFLADSGDGSDTWHRCVSLQPVCVCALLCPILRPFLNNLLKQCPSVDRPCIIRNDVPASIGILLLAVSTETVELLVAAVSVAVPLEALWAPWLATISAHHRPVPPSICHTVRPVRVYRKDPLVGVLTRMKSALLQVFSFHFSSFYLFLLIIYSLK